MATTSTIGTSSRNYSTITAWHAAFATGGWIGECYNDSEFNENPYIGGSSAPNYEILRPATGQALMDTNTNPLKYNQSLGVGLKTTTAYSFALQLSGYVTVERMQIWQAGAGNSNICIFSDTSAADIVINKCLVLNTDTGVSGVSGISFISGNAIVSNTVAIVYSGSGMGTSYGSSLVFANNTCVVPSDQTSAGYAFNGASGNPKITNCAGFGFGGGFILSAGQSPTGGNNATDAASIGFGSGNLTSQTYASQFNGVTTASQDFTLKSTANLVDAGATDTTDIPAAVDIFNTSRPQGSAWDIGAHEYISGAPPPPTRRNNFTLMGVS